MRLYTHKHYNLNKKILYEAKKKKTKDFDIFDVDVKAQKNTVLSTRFIRWVGSVETNFG